MPVTIRGEDVDAAGYLPIHELPAWNYCLRNVSYTGYGRDDFPLQSSLEKEVNRLGAFIPKPEAEAQPDPSFAAYNSWVEVKLPEPEAPISKPSYFQRKFS